MFAVTEIQTEPLAYEPTIEDIADYLRTQCKREAEFTPAVRSQFEEA